MKKRILIIRIKLSAFLLKLGDKIFPRIITKETVLKDAQIIYPYAIVLWSDDDIWVNAFRVFVDRGLFNKNEYARFKRKADLQRISKAKKQAEYLNTAETIVNIEKSKENG